MMATILESRGPIRPLPVLLRSKVKPYVACARCGCTVDDACVTNGRPCRWSTPFLCSRCDLEQVAA